MSQMTDLAQYVTSVIILKSIFPLESGALMGNGEY